MVDERSSIWGTAAWSSLAAGAGYGLYKSRAGLMDAFRTGNIDIAAQTARQLRDLGRFSTGRTIQSTPITDALSFKLSSLVDSSSFNVVKTDIASAAYEAMLSTGNISHKTAQGAYRKILENSQIEDVYRSALENIKSTGGDATSFMNRMNNLDSFYSDYQRLEMLKGVTTAKGGFVGPDTWRQPTEYKDLSKAVKARAIDIKGRLTAAAGGTSPIEWGNFYSIRDQIEGKDIETIMMRGKLGEQIIDIPLNDTGLTYGGKGLTSRYITRSAYYKDKSDILNYTDRFVNQLEDTLTNSKNKTALKNAVHDMNIDLIGALNTESARARAQAVWSLPDAMLPAGGRVRARINLQQAVYAGKGEVDEKLRNQLIDEALTGGRQLYPIGSPDVVAKGTMMRSNIAEDLYGPMGKLIPLEKRPTQFIREQFGVTERAKWEAPWFKGSFGEHFHRVDRKIQGKKYKQLLYGAENPYSSKAYTSPQLMTFYAKPENLETGPLSRKMFNEEMLIARDASSMLEYERVIQKQITLEEGFRVNDELLKAIKGTRMGEVVTLQNPLSNGQFLGIERATGKELFSGAQRANAQIIAAELIDDNTLNLYQREVRSLGDKDYWKFFSEDVKYLGRTAQEREMNEVLRLAGAPLEKAYGQRNMIAGQAIEAIAGGAVLKKNQMAMMNQQIEALGAIAGDIADTGQLTSLQHKRLRRFMNNPSKFLGIHRLKGKDLAVAERQIQNSMVSFARHMGFNQQQMGLTFGLMETGVAESLGIADAVAQSKGVIGLSKLRLGDLPYEGGAGGLASFEQTGFRALSMKGTEGQRMAAELATRLKGKGDIVAADRMMASLIGATSMSDKAKLFIDKAPIDPKLLAELGPNNIIQQTGRYVNIGQKLKAFGGSSRIYIPGLDEAGNILRSTISDKGMRIESQVTRELQNLQSLLKSSSAKEEIEASAEILRTRVIEATEKQAAARGKVLGSRFLTGIRQTDQIADNAFRISPKTARNMMDELIESAVGNDQIEFLKEQKRLLLEENKSVIGGMWRHPTTGPESFQFVHYKVDKDIADELISAPRMIEEIEINGKRQMVDVSHMVGFKGDFDKDQFALAAISDRDTAKRASKGMEAGRNRGYTQYLFNHYAMKDMLGETKGKTANILNKSYAEAMKTGARNLTTAKIATPQVNVALQKLKLGLQYTAPEKYRPMAELFFHLEEAAIGGKHGAYQGALYQDIADAVRLRDASKMESVVGKLMGEEYRVISGSIAGRKYSMRYSPSEFAQQAISAVETVGEDVEYAYKAARAAKGNVSDNLTELMTMYYKRRTGSLDVAQSLMQAKDYGMEGFEQVVNRSLRKMDVKKGIITKALSKAKAPMVAGAVLATGIMLAAPVQSGSLKPQEGSSAGRNLMPSDLGPQGPGMNPPEPRIMTSPKTYDMTGIETASRAKIRMNVNDSNVSNDDFMRQSNTLSNNGNVRIRTTDDRNALNPQRLANKIHERL